MGFAEPRYTVNMVFIFALGFLFEIRELTIKVESAKGRKNITVYSAIIGNE
jgi:hypothetical protein